MTFSTPSTIGHGPQVPTNINWYEESLSPSIHISTHPKILHINEHPMLTRAKTHHSKPKTFLTYVEPQYVKQVISQHEQHQAMKL